jgi:hypothetical protein
MAAVSHLQTNKARTPRVHCVYFACDKHFAGLYLSLKSLARLRLPFIGKIYLYLDKDDFLSPAHERELRKLGFELVPRKCERVTGWGEAAVSVEVSAFAEIGQEINSDDYLAKIDSDVIFVSGDTFRGALASNKDLYGQLVDYWEPEVFFQGGCYFIRGALLPEFGKFEMALLPKVVDALGNETARSKQRLLNGSCPDEAAIYFFLKEKTKEIVLTDFMVSPYDMFNLVKPVTAIHYVRSRAKMSRFELFKATTVRDLLLKSGPFGRKAVACWRACKAPFRQAKSHRPA